MIVFKKFKQQDFDCPVITDCKIAELYGIRGSNVYILPRGEAAKTFEQAEKLCRWLLSKNVERGDAVAAVGGGSIGDLAGFVAGIYKRGLKLVHVPTTLIAQIDSSIGGKTALDLDGVKNAVGSFVEADTVIDTDFLLTLDDEQITSGMGELFKYRMLNSQIDNVYKQNYLGATVRACVEFKEQICREDPFDYGARQKLNFGHTIGHALELSCGLTHGAAVANGLYYETELARKLGLCDDAYAECWKEEIKCRFDIAKLSLDALRLVRNDKKNSNGQIGFVLPREFGKVFVPFDKLRLLIDA